MLRCHGAKVSHYIFCSWQENPRPVHWPGLARVPESSQSGHSPCRLTASLFRNRTSTAVPGPEGRSPTGLSKEREAVTSQRSTVPLPSAPQASQDFSPILPYARHTPTHPPTHTHTHTHTQNCTQHPFQSSYPISNVAFTSQFIRKACSWKWEGEGWRCRDWVRKAGECQ